MKSKICRRCGEAFTRPRGTSYSSWSARVYCCQECYLDKPKVDKTVIIMDTATKRQAELNKTTDNNYALNLETKIYTPEEIEKIKNQITPLENIRTGLIKQPRSAGLYGLH